MADVAQYRFIPWTRRGLATKNPVTDTGQALPSRPEVSVGVTVTGAGQSAVDLSLYGPGDVLGLDTRLIVRADPQPNSTDVEPNYLPAVEFDPPDLPWMFTPARAGTDRHLRPWLVLVCVDLSVIDAPHLPPGPDRGPLPVLEIPANEIARELPDLRESWAWAHAQVAVDKDDGPVTNAVLQDEPALNVSRIICPRRLESGRRYAACLVPAFDQGVERGRTGRQPEGASVGPAWDVSNPQTLVLPVYFHWEFATGPAGDFEELARRLVPFECPPTVGVAPMHVGHAGPELPVITAGSTGAQLGMDGALRSITRSSGEIGDVKEDLVDAIRRAVNSAEDYATGEADDETPVLGPPLYGGWHVGARRLPDGLSGWFNELNLDPRTRAGAAVGADVVKANQQDLIQEAWEQVGQILAANALLNNGKLSAEILRRLRDRHIATLPVDRLVQLTAPLANRVLLEESTVRHAAMSSSMPDAATDPAMRRITGGRSPIMRRAARSVGAPMTQNGAAAPSRLIGALADGRLEIDPNAFVPDGVSAMAAFERASVPRGGSEPVDLSEVGLPVTMPANVLRDGRARYREASRGDMVSGPGAIRSDLRDIGVMTGLHLEHIEQTPTPDGGTLGDFGVREKTLQDIRTATLGNPRATALLIDASKPTIRVDALDVDATGTLVTRAPGRDANVIVGRVDRSVGAAPGRHLASTIVNLAPGSLSSRRSGDDAPLLSRRLADQPVTVSRTDVLGRALSPPLLPTNTVPSPILDSVVVTRFEAAWKKVAEESALLPALPNRSVVPFRANLASDALLGATDPHLTIPNRLRTMLHLAEGSLLEGRLDWIQVPERIDRVMAFPTIPMPVYQYLAEYDQDRFVPGADAIPPNAITLLETNPRFIAAFMVGVNHEMNGELLWRGYPTDRRATTLTRFWDWFDDGADIEPIHTWRSTNLLRSQPRTVGDGQIVLLVRGDLLRRYPNTVVIAWRGNNGALVDPPAVGDTIRPVFAGTFAPDFTFYGFPFDQTKIQNEEWFFVLEEQPTEPRFGFDVPSAVTTGPIGTWSDVDWGDVGTEAGTHLSLAANPLNGRTIGRVTFGRDSAHMAHITLQHPVRVAIPGHYIDGTT